MALDPHFASFGLYVKIRSLNESERMSDALKAIHPNDLARINPPETVVDKANWPSDSRRELLKRMLEASLDVTIPTPGLLKAFEQPLTVEAFSSLITMDPTPLGDIENDFEDSRYQKSYVFNLAPQSTSSEELLDMRNAHRAMSILTAEQPQLNIVLRTKPFEIIAPMFRAFRTQNSKASVFHLCKVIDVMLKMNPEAVLTYLTGPRLKLCLQGLLANLHCSAVVDTVFSLITIRCSLENGLRPDTLRAYHKKLGHSNPIGTISEFAVSPDASVALRIGATDLILRLLLHYDAIPLELPNDSDLGESFLFKSLLNEQFLEGLAQAAESTDDASDSALMLFAALCKLAAKGKLATTAPIAPVEDEDDKPKPAVPENQKPGGRRRLKDFVPPPQAPAPKEDRLTKLGNELKSSLKSESISTACAKALAATEVVVKDADASSHKQKHTSYECVRPFTYRRLEWLRVMNHLLELDYRIAVPWKSLVAWQQQYPQNSMLQNEFSKALQTVLTASASADECKPAVVDCKLVSLLIKRAPKLLLLFVIAADGR